MMPLAFAGLMAAGCATVGPDYVRPEIGVPDAFRAAQPEDAGAPADAAASPEVSLADAEWAAIFADEALRDLIATALARNHDMAIAASRILQTEAILGITRSHQFPVVDAQAVGQGQRSSVGTGDARTGGVLQIGAATAWEIDFWGRYRRATESARAQLLASAWGRRAVAASLVSGVAEGYFTLRALDLELEIAARTLETREESLRITEVRERGGVAGLVDVRQAEQLVYGAQAAIVTLRRLVEQQENALRLLIGAYPGPVVRGQPLTEQPHPPGIPEGLPSALLERRPDIRLAEQSLAAATADIGVARAEYFPRVTLTGSGGVASTALSALFSGPTLAWTAAASAVQPIFNAGRIDAEVALAEARRDEAEIAYQQAIHAAFREVADALAGYQRTRELRETQEQLVVAAQDARRLADVRYQGGTASYLEVLDSDTRLFDAELGLVRARLGELTAFVEIYRALGGGWQE